MQSQSENQEADRRSGDEILNSRERREDLIVGSGEHSQNRSLHFLAAAAASSGGTTDTGAGNPRGNCFDHGDDHGDDDEAGNLGLGFKRKVMEDARVGNKRETEKLGLRVDLMREIDLEAEAEGEEQEQEEENSEARKRGSCNGFQELTLSYMCNDKGKKLQQQDREFLQGKGISEDYREMADEIGVGIMHKKLKTGTLQLSLALPQVSAKPSNLAEVSTKPSSSNNNNNNMGVVPSRSVHTANTRTSSDGFTTSLDFSQSNTYVHNPSCSLTYNSMDNHEYSVASYPSGSEHGWQLPDVIEPARSNGGGGGGGGFMGLNQERSRSGRENHNIPLYQKVLQNGHERGDTVSQGTYSNRGGKNFSFARECWSSPSQSVSSWDTKSLQQKHNDSEFPNHGNSILGRDWGFIDPKMIERILHEIVSEPVSAMAQRLQDLPDTVMEDVLSYVKSLVGNDQRNSEQLSKYQRILQNRGDLQIETLRKCNRNQLEILVSLKTGLPVFLNPSSDLKSPDLAEIYLDLKCRNSTCLSALPVDDCECQFCLQKNGFCSQCMCMVCSKFDCASETCSWVGCDFCLHWCHTDCGLSRSYIKPSLTEMQFNCIACNHSSELYGFVKAVFKTCAKTWSPAKLSKELDYVKRIFQSSEDCRGKQLHVKASELLLNLNTKSCPPHDVCDGILSFLNDCEKKSSAMNNYSVKEAILPNRKEESSVMVRESYYKINPSSIDKFNKTIESNNVIEGHKPDVAELQYGRLRNKCEIDELESHVRMKKAEAEMFQARADDARREAEGLRRIVLAKNEKIEEEYAAKLARLCLSETEERKKQKLQELKLIETAHRDYYIMKHRMETDIKELLRKMELTRLHFFSHC